MISIQSSASTSSRDETTLLRNLVQGVAHAQHTTTMLPQKDAVEGVGKDRDNVKLPEAVAIIIF